MVLVFGKKVKHMLNNTKTIPTLILLVALTLSLTPNCFAKNSSNSGQKDITSEKVTTIASWKDRFEKVVLSRSGSPELTYYISKTSSKKPIMLFIQGSGCTPVFVKTKPDGEDHYSTVFSVTTSSRDPRFSVMVVEKPGSPPLPPKNRGVATECPNEFNEYFSFDSWLKDLQTAYHHALKQPWVDDEGTLVIGSSEGATMAAALAEKNSSITHVALMSPSGSSQLFDFLAQQHLSQETDNKKQSNLQAIAKSFQSILEDPKNTENFVLGHTNLRWSTFMPNSTSDLLLNSKARVYIVSGMGDQSTPALSSEIIFSKLLINNRDVTIVRKPDAGHSLLKKGQDYSELESDFKAVRDWYQN